MRVLYAPSKRQFSDDLHNNVACGFDSCVLESLLEMEGAEVVYLPHFNTHKKIVESVLDIFKDSIKFAKRAPKQIDVLVSDASNLALKYALWTHNPSLLCLFGFHSISFAQNDKYSSLLDSCVIPIYSLKELKLTLMNYPAIKGQKSLKIQQILDGVVI